MNQYVMLAYGTALVSFLALTLSILRQKRSLYKRLKDGDVE